MPTVQIPGRINANGAPGEAGLMGDVVAGLPPALEKVGRSCTPRVSVNAAIDSMSSVILSDEIGMDRLTNGQRRRIPKDLGRWPRL